jgi:hypothetical protein
MELTAERKKVNKDITQTIRIIISAMRRSLEISLGQVMMESESKHIYVLPVPKGLITAGELLGQTIKLLEIESSNEIN